MKSRKPGFEKNQTWLAEPERAPAKRTLFVVVLVRWKDKRLALVRLDKDDVLSLVQSFVDSKSFDIQGFHYHANGHSCFAVSLPNHFYTLTCQRNLALGNAQKVGTARKL